MPIKVVRSIHAVPAPVWDALMVRCGAPVFYWHAYLAAYEASPLHAVDGYAYLVDHGEDGELALGLPVFFERRMDPLGVLAEPFPGVRRQTAGLLTHVWHCYDTWLPARSLDGTVQAVLAALAGLAAEAGASWYGLVNVDGGGELAARLSTLGLTHAQIDERFWLDLSAFDDLDGYIGHLKPRARANLRRYCRRAAEAGLTVTAPAAGDADLDAIVSLAQATAARFGNAGFYPAGAFQRFVRLLGGAARVLELRVGGRLLAAGVCLVDSRRFHTWTCGIDYGLATTFSPYYLLFLESVRAAIAERTPILEGGRRNAAFKVRHGLHRRPLLAYLVPTGNP
jgi:predicted N-acyltransferase